MPTPLKPTVALDRNASVFDTIAACRAAARQAGWSRRTFDKWSGEAMTQNGVEFTAYVHEYFDIRETGS